MSKVPTHVCYEEASRAIVLPDLISVIREATLTGKRSRMSIAQRSIAFCQKKENAFVTMPAYSDDDLLFIAKVGTVFSHISKDPRSAVNSIVVVYSGRTGMLIATVDGAAVTNAKCAAVAALATQICTYEKPHSVAIVGAGTQALQQFRAISCVRVIERLSIYSRGEARMKKFVNQILSTGFPEEKLNVASDINKICRGASIIATTTTASTPLGSFAGLDNGVHINCMGGHSTEFREIPNDVLMRSVLIVEDKLTASAEAGMTHATALDFEQALTTDGLADKNTIFSSVGHAFHDYLVVKYILAQHGLLCVEQ